MEATARPSQFGIRISALLWVATLASNVGTWMHDVGTGVLPPGRDRGSASV